MVLEALSWPGSKKKKSVCVGSESIWQYKPFNSVHNCNKFLNTDTEQKSVCEALTECINEKLTIRKTG